ncbi:MAG TPA: STAS domain-containing protein [Anaerolineaceae bacterium]|jgi:anti-anti-sigma factor|nr:STAS domain-containing protein [Anaerolineaceae bacterium]
MDFQVSDYKRCKVVKTAGRIDSATAPEVEKILTDLIQGKKTIVIDMSEVTFVSSAGWWAIIRAYKELQKGSGGEIVLAGLNENVRSSMELIGILPYFPTYDNLVEAIANL